MARGSTRTAGRVPRRRADGRDHPHSGVQRPANGPAVRETAVREPGRAGSGRRTVAVLGTGVLAIGTDMFVVAGILGGIAADLGVTVGSAGLAVTVFALTYATGAVLLAPFLSAQPPRRVLVVSAAAFAVMNVLSALAPTLPALLAARVLSALAASAFVPAAAGAAVAAAPASRRGRALGTVVGCMSAATVLGAPAGVLLASASTWRAALALPAVLAAATVAGLVLTRDASSRAAEPVARCRAAARERLLPLASPAVAATLAVTFLLMTASYSTYTYLPLLLSDATVPPGSGLFIAVFGLAGIAGTWWGGRAADRRGPGRVVGPAVAVSAAAFAALPHTSSTGVAAAVVVAGWGTAVWGFVPAQQHRLIGLCTAAPPLLLALHSGAVHLGSAAGSLLGGLVVDSAGAGRLWTVAVFCCGAAWVVHTALARKEDRS